MERFDFSAITVDSLSGIFQCDVPKHDSRIMKHRTNSGIVLCTQGQLIYSMNGKTFPSDPTHVLLLPEGGCYDSFCNEKAVCPMINFHISGEQIPTEIVCCEVESSEGFFQDWRKMETLWAFRKPGYRLRCLSGLYELIAKLCAPVPREDEERFRYLQPAIRYLESHYGDPMLTNERLAGQANISTAYFRRLFTEKYGVSPRQYIQEIRLNKAKDLLRDGQFSVSEIAEVSGYASIYHFSRAFRTHTGYTPTEFARYYRGEAEKK